MQNVAEPSDSPPDHRGEESLGGGSMMDRALDELLDARFSDDGDSEESEDEDEDEDEGEGEVN